MSPIVSIIIPTYNREHTLLQTLQSVSKQTSDDWECIIVDDGSTDNTISLVKKFSASDQRFRFFERERTPKGACTCRNIGVEKSNGDYLIFLDSDDLLTPNCVEDRLTTFRKFPENDFLVFATQAFYNHPDDDDTLLNIMTKQNPIYRFLNIEPVWLSTGPIWKKSTITDLGGWDEQASSFQDWDLSVRALIADKTYDYFSQVDNYWRRGHSNAMNNVIGNEKSLDNQLYLMRKIYTIIGQQNKYQYIPSIRFAYFTTLHKLSKKNVWKAIKQLSSNLFGLKFSFLHFFLLFAYKTPFNILLHADRPPQVGVLFLSVSRKYLSLFQKVTDNSSI
jgi:glycosyltransferase involved in cell wall biosynthesis